MRILHIGYWDNMRTLHINMWCLMLVLINLQGCISVSHVRNLTKGETCLDIVAMDPKNFRKRLNCSTDPNSREWYHCLADQDNIVEYELCSNWKWIEKGKCAYYNPYGEGNVDERYDPCVTDNNRTCSSEQFESMYNTNYSGCYPFGVEQTTFMTSTLPVKISPTKDKRNKVSSGLGITFGIVIPVAIFLILVLVFRLIKQKDSKGDRGEAEDDSHSVVVGMPTPDDENASATTSTLKHTSDQHHAGPTSKTPSDEKEEHVTETTPMLKSNDHHTDTKGVCGETKGDSHIVDMETPTPDNENASATTSTPKHTSDQHHAGPASKIPSDEKNMQDGDDESVTETTPMLNSNDHHTDTKDASEHPSHYRDKDDIIKETSKVDLKGMGNRSNLDESHEGTQEKFGTPPGSPMLANSTNSNKANIHDRKEVLSEENDDITGQPNENKIPSEIQRVNGKREQKTGKKQDISDKDSKTGYVTGVQKRENGGFEIQDQDSMQQGNISKSSMTPAGDGETVHETENTKQNKQTQNISSVVSKEKSEKKEGGDGYDKPAEEESGKRKLNKMSGTTISDTRNIGKPGIYQSGRAQGESENENLVNTGHDGYGDDGDDDASSLHSLESSDAVNTQEKDEVLQKQMYDTLEKVCTNIVKMLFNEIAEYEVGPLDDYFSTGLKKAQVKDLLNPEYKICLSPGEKQVDINNLPVPVFYAVLHLSMKPEKAPKSGWGRSVKKEDKGVGDDIERIMKIYTSYRCIQDPNQIPVETYERWRKIMLAATARLDKEYSTHFSDNVKNPELQLDVHMYKFTKPMPSIM